MGYRTVYWFAGGRAAGYRRIPLVEDRRGYERRNSYPLKKKTGF